jgi:regulatory protein
MTEVKKAINASLNRLLARREHSQQELMAKLTAKRFDPHLCQQQIQSYHQAGWQSDERYCESRINHRIGQGYGAYWIERELLEQDIDPHLIRSKLNLLDQDWVANALSLLQKKYAGADWGSANAIHKAQRFLYQKGYSAEQIKQALSANRQTMNDQILGEDESV